MPSGERAILIEVDDLAEVIALRAALDERVLDARLVPTVSHNPDAPSRSVWAHVLDVVPAAQTVLVTVDDNDAVSTLRREVREVARPLGSEQLPPPERTVRIPVVYDGPDLEDVALRTGLTQDEVVAAHTAAEYTVAFGGFSPGFVYLVGGDPRLEVPRHHEPRTKVRPGSVGVAGKFSGVYPRDSPGGWQLLGHTDAVMWDIDRNPPELLRPGYGVRFERAEAQAEGDSGGGTATSEQEGAR
nr:allophanate hydrolase subunit 1 [Kineosphaera limosa]